MVRKHKDGKPPEKKEPLTRTEKMAIAQLVANLLIAALNLFRK